MPNKIVVAHVGGNRAVSSDLISIMTHDHKPYLPHEKKRIEKVGGIVINNTLRQEGNGSITRWWISRMFGDIKLAGVIAEPDVSIFDYNFKMLATTSSDLDTEFFPAAQFMKKEGLPPYTVKMFKSKSGYWFIIMASADVWNNLPKDSIADYSSYDFMLCDVATDSKKGLSDIDKTSADYQCARLGASEIATHIVESVLAKHGLSQKSLELATELLHVASVQKEKFNLNSFINPDIVQKKSLFQKIKGWFINQKTREQRILQEINKIRGNESIAIVAWDPKNEPQKKLKSKLPQRKTKNN